MKKDKAPEYKLKEGEKPPMPSKEEVMKNRPKFSPEDIRQMEKGADAFIDEVIEPEKAAEEKEAKKDFDEIIESEKDFLSLFDDDRYNLQVVYKRKLLKFKVKPIDEGDDLSFLNIDMSTFADITSKEQLILKKVRAGEELTEKEKLVLERFNKRHGDEMAEKSMEIMHKLLSQHLTPPSFRKNMKKRMEFWKKADFILKMFLVEEVQKVLGLDPDSELKLFQDGRQS